MLPRRRFRLLDAIVLVAAIAIGLAWARVHERYRSIDRMSLFNRVAWEYGPTWRKVQVGWEATNHYLLPSMAMLTLALALLSLTSPRPGLSRLTRRPGVVSCWAASFGLAVEFLSAIVSMLRNIVQHGWRLESHGPHYRFVWWEELLPWIAPGWLGLAIASSWFLLIVSQRWRPEPDWIDRTGRLLGGIWIAWGIIAAVEPWSFCAIQRVI